MLLLTEVGADNRAAAEAADLNLDLAVDSTTAARIKVCIKKVAQSSVASCLHPLALNIYHASVVV